MGASLCPRRMVPFLTAAHRPHCTSRTSLACPWLAPSCLRPLVSADDDVQNTLHKLRASVRKHLGEERDVVGANMAGLRFLRQRIDDAKAAKTFVE